MLRAGFRNGRKANPVSRAARDGPAKTARAEKGPFLAGTGRAALECPLGDKQTTAQRKSPARFGFARIQGCALGKQSLAGFRTGGRGANPGKLDQLLSINQ